MTKASSGKILLITGGGRGIGAAVAIKAAAEGYRVAVNYLADRTAAEAVVNTITRAGGEAVAIAGDVSKYPDVLALYAEVDRRLGRLTHLVNNAGITGKSSRLDAADPQMIAECIAINTTGAIWVAREAVLRMAKRHGGAGGAIVNISSAAVTIGSPGEYVWYAASKGAIDSLTFGLAKELADDGIRVNAVQPGLTETEIHQRSSGDGARVERLKPMIPLKRVGQPDEIAASVLFLLSEASSYTTGSILRVSGGR